MGWRYQPLSLGYLLTEERCDISLSCSTIYEFMTKGISPKQVSLCIKSELVQLMTHC